MRIVPGKARVRNAARPVTGWTAFLDGWRFSKVRLQPDAISPKSQAEN
jgi:hypothetical protein